MSELPTGNMAFLFTDIEGSTKLWEEHPEAMRDALARHDALLREAIETHHGTVFKTVGDAFCAAFFYTTDAVAAALAAQLALNAEPWQNYVREQGTELSPHPLTPSPFHPFILRVRMAVHIGPAQARDGDYFGPTLNRVARLLMTGHGGQTLLSQAAYEDLEDALPEEASLRALGEHRLKDLQMREHLFQLLHPALPAEFPALMSLDYLPNNLPQQLTSFIGREREIAQIKALLSTQGKTEGGKGRRGEGDSPITQLPNYPTTQSPNTRLLTLTGAGGCGKTRLALQVAAEMLEEFRDGVWLVELGALFDPALVPQTVATVLGVKEGSGLPVLTALTDFLRPRTALLLLDNCEHIIEAAARLAETLVRACPRLRILVSSREPLGIAGETPWRVPSLSLPNPRRLPSSPEALAQYEAVRLFVERAQTLTPAFTVTQSNAPAVAQVCQRLDGIPLALELAAARVKVLSVEQIAQRLDDRFHLLTGGSRTALPRQQTLRAAIDWSYDLLSEAERILLRRLSVFVGGWTLEAAEAVCTDRDEGRGMRDEKSLSLALTSAEVLDLLSRLVDKSLVIVEPGIEGEARYRLLETMRQYAGDRLAESGEAERLRAQHRDWFLDLAERIEPKLSESDQAVWLDRLDAEHDNLRAALEWSLEEPEGEEQGPGARGQGLGENPTPNAQRPTPAPPTPYTLHPTPSAGEAALRLAGAMWGLWYVRGYFTEGRESLARALAKSESAPTPARAKALQAAGSLARNQGDLAAARPLFEESLAIRQALGDKRNVAASLYNIGLVASNQGDYAAARSLFEQALEVNRELGNRPWVASNLNSLGAVVRYQGDYAMARALHEQSLEIARELGDRRGIAHSFNSLGVVAFEQGEYAAAQSLLEQALTINRELGNRSWEAENLSNLGRNAYYQGDYAAAHALHEQSLTIERDLGNRRGVANVLRGLAMAALRQNAAASARSCLKEALAIQREMGVRRDMDTALDGFAALAIAQGRMERATRLYAASETLREALGSPLAPVERAQQKHDLTTAREALGEPAFTAAWEAGCALTLTEALDEAMRE